jgi:hypothetical protein
MRKEFYDFDDAPTLADVLVLAPWACAVFATAWGFAAFESATDAAIWEDQK